MASSMTVGVPESGPNTRAGGFQAQLRGVSLADLVQLECLNRTQRVVRVSSRMGVGYLYFRNGQIVHASCRSLEGEAAALEILGWSDGSFFGCDKDWPALENVREDWQNLLMRALQARDEQAKGTVVPLSLVKPPSDELLLDLEDDMQNPRASSIAGVPIAPAHYLAFVRVSARGVVSETFGSGEELADAASYVARLVRMIGEMLGLDEPLAMEFACKQSRCLVALEPDGQFEAVLASKSADVSALRERLLL